MSAEREGVETRHPSCGVSVAVVIPAYKKTLLQTERISLQQCLRKLGSYPVCFVMPRGLDTSSYVQELRAVSSGVSVSFKFFPARYFRSLAGYNRLLLSPRFFRTFRTYEFILIHQLDCFVFRDELVEWCLCGYDLLAPPWLEGYGGSRVGHSVVGVGNGGFSLRNVRQHLRVLHSLSYIVPPATIVRRYLGYNWRGRLHHLPEVLLNLSTRNNTHFLLNDYGQNEDFFWGRHASRNFRWFRVADAVTAMRFGVEVEPDRFYAMNGRCLPFGCHAWQKYGYAFWRPFIEAEGFTLPASAVGVQGDA